MRSSEKMNEVHTSLVALQGRMPKLVKGGRANTGSYSYTYLELDELLETLREPMHEVGLGVIQEALTAPPLVGVRTRIVHISGQWLETDPLLLPAGPNAQSAGSAISYARRYQLIAVLGVAAEDDDGARASMPAGAASFGEGDKAPALSSPAPAGTPEGTAGVDPSGGGDPKTTAYSRLVSECGRRGVGIMPTLAHALGRTISAKAVPDALSVEDLLAALAFLAKSDAA